VLLTRAPLYRGRSPFSLDLHVLGAPLTFVLSQDQTLQFGSFGAIEGLSPDRAFDARYYYALPELRGTKLEACAHLRDFSRTIRLSFQGPRGGLSRAGRGT
jgi:hypothetical protein